MSGQSYKGVQSGWGMETIVQKWKSREEGGMTEPQMHNVHSKCMASQHRQHENCDRSPGTLIKMSTILQKTIIGNVKFATVRWKCIACQHRERGSGDRSSENRLIMLSIRQKFMSGNTKMATIRQKCIARQHREHEGGDRSSEMRPRMLTVERKSLLSLIS